MSYNVFSGTLNPAQLNSNFKITKLDAYDAYSSQPPLAVHSAVSHFPGVKTLQQELLMQCKASQLSSIIYHQLDASSCESTDANQTLENQTLGFCIPSACST